MCIRDRYRDMEMTPDYVRSAFWMSAIQGLDANVISVSYTHLDVYKRQTWCFGAW